MNRSEQINELAAALSKAQAKIRGAIKDSENPFFKSSYADLSSVWDAIREPLASNGLCVMQTTEPTERGMMLITTLAHSSGQWIEGRYPVSPVKNDPQGVGSAMSYSRRYALAAIAGVAQIDDDGEASMNRPNLPNGKPAPRVVPEQPVEGDGVMSNGYMIPYGPLARMSIERADPAKLKAYIEEIEAKAKNTNKPIPKWAEELIKHAEPIIGAWENSLSKEGMFT